MKLYNNGTGKIEEVPSMIRVDGINRYSKKMSESQLNQAGYYRVTSSPAIDKKYYKEGPVSWEIVDGKAVKTIEKIELPLDNIKKRMLSSISESFKKFGERPVVDTGLGYKVDGGLADLQRFQIGAELGIEFIKDIDGNTNSIDTDGYAIVIQKIKEYGLAMYQTKWTREAEVQAIDNIEDCIAYEKFPYEVEQLIVDENGDAILDDDGNEQYETVTKYKNKCTEW